MEMIIAHLHEQSREIVRKARIVLLAAQNLEKAAGKAPVASASTGSTALENLPGLPLLRDEDRAAAAALSTGEAILKEVHILRPQAVALKMAVLENVFEYPTQAAWHRRLARCCEASALATQAEAIVTGLREGADNKLATSVLHQSQAFAEEAEAHWELAQAADKQLR